MDALLAKSDRRAYVTMEIDLRVWMRKLTLGCYSLCSIAESNYQNAHTIA